MDYSSITELYLSNKGLTELPDLSHYTNLKTLDCSDNQITNLDNLPLSLIYLDCGCNKITHLDNFPLSLTRLVCGNNEITHLDNLPPTLTKLNSEI